MSNQVKPEFYLRRLANGQVIAIGGPAEGAGFGPSTRKIQLGTGEVYELLEEDLPDAYEEPDTGPGKPLTITAEEKAAFDAETARLEAEKTKPVEPVVKFAEIVVVDETPVVEDEVPAASEDQQGDGADGADGEADSGDEAGDEGAAVAADGDVAGVADEVAEVVKPARKPRKSS